MKEAIHKLDDTKLHGRRVRIVQESPRDSASKSKSRLVGTSPLDHLVKN